MRKKIRNTFIVAFLILVAHPVGAIDKVSLHALFKGKAIVMIDGARRVLAVGDTSPEGVKLVSTNTQDETAEIEIAGKAQQLSLGVIASSFAPTGKASITLYPDASGHFFADGTINGSGVRFLVDTGATTIAMNSITAKRLGIDYAKIGRRSAAVTAGGMVRTYVVRLNNVQVGDIHMSDVEAGVVEGSYPSEVLLGMSFLGHLDMKRDSQKLELMQR